MNFQFTEAVDVSYPDETRPGYRPTFMLQGIAVTWDTAPTTSEELQLLIVVPDFNSHEFLIRDLNPSTDSLTAWFHTIPAGPIAIPVNEVVKVTYLNTDRNTITIKFVGYYTSG